MACDWEFGNQIFSRTGTATSPIEGLVALNDLRGFYPGPEVLRIRVLQSGLGSEEQGEVSPDGAKPFRIQNVEVGDFIRRTSDPFVPGGGEAEGLFEGVSFEEAFAGTSAGGDLTGTYPAPSVVAISTVQGATLQSLSIGSIGENQLLMRNASNQIVGVDASTGGSTTFTGLTDTPNSLGAGTEGRFINVNSAGSALAFAPLVQEAGPTLRLDGANLNLASNQIQNIRTATFVPVPAATVVSAPTTISFASSQKQRITLNATTTITLSFPGVGTYMLILTQGSAGNFPTFQVTGGSVLYSRGQLLVGGASGDRTAIALFFDGTDVFVTSSDKMSTGSVVLT